MPRNAFEKVKRALFKRYWLLNRTQKQNDLLEAFHAALTAQLAKSDLGTLEDELVRYFFHIKIFGKSHYRTNYC